MKDHLESTISVLLTLAAVTMATTYVWRQFRPNAALESAAGLTDARGAIQEPRFYPDWREWLGDGVSIGAESAPVVIIEFSDLECPFCRKFHEIAMKETRDSSGSTVSLEFIHLPLSIHRFSEVAAVASECAAMQDRFVDFVDVLFLKQDSIGLKSWGSYAAEAAVPYPDQLAICVDEQIPLERVRAARALADEIGISATPTVFVNGWRLPHPPTEAELSGLIEGILAGQDPFSGKD